MKRVFISSLLMFMLFSCTKKMDDSSLLMNINESPPHLSEIKGKDIFLDYSPLTPRELDSIKKIDNLRNTNPQLSILSQGPEYSDYSDTIHLSVFYAQTSTKQNHPTISVSVTASYAMVGGGALVSGTTGNGAFITESRPINSTTWRASSKDHIVVDPHYLTVYAIGLRIDGVDPAFLRSKIHITSATGSADETCTAGVSVYDNCLLIGGGAIDNWTGYGNLLTGSYPYSNTWQGAGKSYRRSSRSTITVYAIGIENISYPTVGYLSITTNATSAGVQYGEGYCYAPVNSGFALTCPGGYDTWSGYGRMLKGLYPLGSIPDAQVISKDTPGYLEYGANFAFAVGIEKRPY